MITVCLQPKAQSLVDAGLGLLTCVLGDYVLEPYEADGGDPHNATDSRVALAVATADHGKVVGAAQGLVMDAGSRMRMAQRLLRGNVSDGKVQEAVRSLTTSDLSVGNMFSLAVDPEMRGRGVARQLVTAREDWLIRQGANLIFAEAWHNPAAPDARELYAGLGYDLVASIQEYWTVEDLGDRNPNRQRCPFCGAICHCAASVYAKAFGVLEV